MFTEQIIIFQEGLFVRRTDHNFPGDLFLLVEHDNNFPGRCICSPNRKHFFKKGMSAQIPIFQEQFFFATKQIPNFQKHFFGYRADTDFPGNLF